MEGSILQMMKIEGISFDRLTELELKLWSRISSVREQLRSTSMPAKCRDKKLGKLKRLTEARNAVCRKLLRSYPNEYAAMSLNNLGAVAVSATSTSTTGTVSTIQTVPVPVPASTTPAPVSVVKTQPYPAQLDTTKKKCRKFLANLLELTRRESKMVENNVRSLVQELVDCKVEPEEFCERLQRLLNASPQPTLIGFLKKSLPLLRQAMVSKELVIDGIHPPPPSVVFSSGTTSASHIVTCPPLQATQLRQTATTTSVRVTTPIGAEPGAAPTALGGMPAARHRIVQHRLVTPSRPSANASLPASPRYSRPAPSEEVVLAKDSDEEDAGLSKLMKSPSSSSVVVPSSQEDPPSSLEVIPSSQQVVDLTSKNAGNVEEARPRENDMAAEAGVRPKRNGEEAGEEFHLVRDGKEVHLMGNGKEFRPIRKFRGVEALPRVVQDGDHEGDSNTATRILTSTPRKQRQAEEGGLAPLDLSYPRGAADQDDDDRSVISCTPPPDDARAAVSFRFTAAAARGAGDREKEKCTPGSEAGRGQVPIIRLRINPVRIAEIDNLKKKRNEESGSDPAAQSNDEAGGAEMKKKNKKRSRDDDEAATACGMSDAETKRRRRKKKSGNDEGADEGIVEPAAHCNSSVTAAAEMKTKKNKKEKSREDEEVGERKMAPAAPWNSSKECAEVKKNKEDKEAREGLTMPKKKKRKTQDGVDEREVREQGTPEHCNGSSKPELEKKKEERSAACTDGNSIEQPSTVVSDDSEMKKKGEKRLKKERKRIKDELKKLKKEKKRAKREKRNMMEEVQNISPGDKDDVDGRKSEAISNNAPNDANEKIERSPLVQKTKENNSMREDKEAATELRENEKGDSPAPAPCIPSPLMPFDKDLRVFEYEKQVALILLKHQPASREILRKYYKISDFLRPSFRAILLTVHPLHRREALRRIEAILPPPECLQRCMQAVQGTFDPASVSTSSTTASAEARSVSSPISTASAPGPDVGMPLSSAQQDISKEKCRSFLSNLLALSERELCKQKQEVVRSIVQELIDSEVEIEVFWERLECVLKIVPQPFFSQRGKALKMGLPFLRKAMLDNEIDLGQGIRPPCTPDVLSTNAGSTPHHRQRSCAPPGLNESMHRLWGELSGSEERDWNAFLNAMAYI